MATPLSVKKLAVILERAAALQAQYGHRLDTNQQSRGLFPLVAVGLTGLNKDTATRLASSLSKPGLRYRGAFPDLAPSDYKFYQPFVNQILEVQKALKYYFGENYALANTPSSLLDAALQLQLQAR